MTASLASAPATEAAINPRYDTVIRRRKTRSVRVGDIWMGSDHPVVVQSMINEDTLDIEGATAGIRRLHEAGCEIVRVTVPSLAHAKAMGEIRQRLESACRGRQRDAAEGDQEPRHIPLSRRGNSGGT